MSEIYTIFYEDERLWQRSINEVESAEIRRRCDENKTAEVMTTQR